MTVQQLGQNLTSYEITQWSAYVKIKQREMDKEQKRSEVKNRPPQETFSIFDLPE
jgi:hypothetical protein